MKGSRPSKNGRGEFGVGGSVREVFVTGEEAEEGAAEVGLLVADGAAQHGVLQFEGVEGALGWRRGDEEFGAVGGFSRGSKGGWGVRVGCGVWAWGGVSED